MDKKRLLRSALSALLTFLTLVGSLGCFATGMDLGYELPSLLWGCALLALLCGFCLNTRHWLIPVVLAAFVLGYWWQEDTLRYALEGILYQVSDLYDRGYGWGILQWSNRHLLPYDLTPGLLALGIPIAAAVSLAMHRGRLTAVGVLFPLLPLAACLLLKDTVPQEEYLGLLLFGVLMLLLTGRVRVVDTHRACTLTLTLTLPLTLGLALLFSFCPKDTYAMQEGAQRLEDWVVALFETSMPEGPALIPGDQARTVDLAGVGQRQKSSRRIMTVRGTENATIYLRGCAYDIYDGTSWSATPGWNSWNLFYSTKDGDTKSLTIRTEQPHSVYYFTYTPYAAPAKVLGGRMRNETGQTSYTVYYRDPLSYGEDWDTREDAIGGQELAEYLQLPDSTRQGAMAILTTKVGVPTETINTGQIWKNALYIAEWVSHRAKYDLNTDQMPEGAEDFALWFLNEADTGYCTHYATAATVLLRAAGIPAQYVTGYLVQVKDGRTVNVTEDNAHAWVEVFINGVGWVMLEPTPAAGLPQDQGTSDTSETRPQTTEPTAAETETSSAPTETAAPTQTTGAETTEPTQTTGAETTEPTQTTESGYSHPTDTVNHPTATAGVGGSDPGKPANRALSGPLQTLLWVLGALAAVLLQWRVRVAVKKALCRHGQPNARALRLWKQLERGCRLAGQKPSADCLLLAQKARFSQHTLTAEELVLLQQALRKAHRRLQKRNILLQLLYTLLLAVY